MALELDKVRRPVRQLRKLLKGLASDPSMRDVHDLRTRSRRVEAIVGMQIAGHESTRHHLLKALKPLRKAAGEVRDMDVLATKARTLAGTGCDASLAILLEHLQARRIEGGRKLMEAVSEKGAEARDTLVQFSQQIERRIHIRAGSKVPHTDAAKRLMDELSGWPAFSAENLHDFRIKVKELRYVLQMTEAADPRFVTALAKAKARIGDWHDWLELGRIANEVLEAGKNRALLREIEEIGKGKLKLAFAAARALRARYLGPHRGGVAAEA